MNIANALKAFIPNEQNIIHHMYTALFEEFKIVNPAFTFVYTNDFAG
jgi:hypothetical protein